MSGGERRRGLLAAARIYLVATPDPEGRWADAVGRALATGLVGVVQLRAKGAGDEAVLRDAATLGGLARAHGALLVVNDRPDLAVRAGADGVHVGEEDPSPRDARREVGPDLLVGVSTHDEREVRRAGESGADYAGLGPCFETSTKALRRAPGGPDLVRRCVPVAAVPLFPIGGIGPGNAASLVAAGAERLAVGAAVLDAPDPAAAVRSLARVLGIPAPRGGDPPKA